MTCLMNYLALVNTATSDSSRQTHIRFGIDLNKTY